MVLRFAPCGLGVCSSGFAKNSWFAPVSGSLEMFPMFWTFLVFPESFCQFGIVSISF